MKCQTERAMHILLVKNMVRFSWHMFRFSHWPTFLLLYHEQYFGMNNTISLIPRLTDIETLYIINRNSLNFLNLILKVFQRFACNCKLLNKRIQVVIKQTNKQTNKNNVN